MAGGIRFDRVFAVTFGDYIIPDVPRRAKYLPTDLNPIEPSGQGEVWFNGNFDECW